MNECKKKSLSVFAFSSTRPFMLFCSCVTQSALHSVSFTLLCPTPCLAPHNALPSFLLVVRPALRSALCAVRYALCIFLRCAVSCVVFCTAFDLFYPALRCPALPCFPALPCPLHPDLSCLVTLRPVIPCSGLSYPAQPHTLPCPALPCPTLPCPALPSPVLPCLVLPHPTLPCPVLHYPALSCLALSCHTLPVCHALSCHVLSCPVLSFPILPCPAIPCPALSCPAQSIRLGGIR